MELLCASMGTDTQRIRKEAHKSAEDMAQCDDKTDYHGFVLVVMLVCECTLGFDHLDLKHPRAP